MNNYIKFFLQVLATVFAGMVAALTGDAVIDTVEWINVIIMTLGCVGVVGAGNLPLGFWKYAKFVVAAATAACVFLTSAITDGLTLTELIQLGLAALAAIGVISAPGPYVRVEKTSPPDLV